MPDIRLQNPNSNTNINQDSEYNIIKKIESLVKDINNRLARTTNFAIIVYLVKNKRQKMLFRSLIEKIKTDYNNKEEVIFINSYTKKPFETEKKLVSSIYNSIKRNKSFNMKEIKGEKYIQLNLEETLKYLEKMHNKYKNEEYDVSSISSAKSPRKLSFENDKKDKKLLGNKTSKKRQKKKFPKQMRTDSVDSFNSFDLDKDEKSLSTYKYLKDNLKPKTNEINNKKKVNYKKNKSKEKEIENVFDKDLPFHTENFDEKNLAEIYQNEIANSLNSVEESKNIINSYKKKLENLQTKLEERDKALEEYKKVKNKLIKEKNDLKVISQVLELKYEYVQNAKNSKYLGDIFEQTKKNLKLYKSLIDSKIKNFKSGLKDGLSLKNKVIKKEGEIVKDSDSINFDDNINVNDKKNLLGMNEYMVKKDYCCLLNKIKTECIMENGNNDYHEENIIEFGNMIGNKMNELLEKIKGQK